MKALTFLFICICLSIPCSAIDDPVAHWKLDETSGSTAYDSAGSNDGTLNDGPEWTTGQSGSALSFDSFGDYVEIPGYKGITGTASRTYSAWVKTTTSGSNPILVSGDPDISGALWQFRIDPTGALRVTVQGGNIIGSIIINDDAWHHVAVTWENDGTPNIEDAKLYVDGVEDTSTTGTPYAITNGVTNEDVMIGGYSASSKFFDGLIDDARIYSSALSSGDILDLSSGIEPSVTPDAHWALDEGSGLTAYDSAGSNDGTLSSGPGRVAGKVGGAFSFNGFGDMIQAIGYKGVTGTQSRTCAAWIKADTAEVYNSEGIFSWGRNDTSGGNWALYLQRDNFLGTPGALAMSVENGVKVGNTDLHDDMWHHIAVVLNSDGSPSISDLKLYVDGVEETYSYIDNSSINTASYYDVMIGCDQWGDTPGPSFFNGKIDDVRIYGRALSDQEVQQLYQEGLSGLSITPTDDFDSSGEVGGPFTPASKVYQLSNTSSEVISWEAVKTQPWLDIDTTSGLLDPNDSVDVTVSLNSNADSLSGGIYTDTITFSDITDPCEIYNQTREVTLTILAPVIELSSTSFDFSGDEGGINPDDQILTVRNAGIGTLNWQITEDCGWLTVNPESGSSTGEADAVILSADITGLAWGNYNCDLTVSDPNAVNSPEIVSVDLEVIGPIIELSESSFDFEAEIDGINPDDQILTIRNVGAGVLNWQVTESCSWLDVEPKSGSSGGEADAVILSVDIEGLGEDDYTCDLTISDPNSENSPQTVQVNLSVVGVPHIWVSPESFDVEVLEGMSLADTFTIGNSGTGALNFSIKTRETSREISQTLLSGRTAASGGSFSTEKMIRLEYEFDEPIVSRSQEYDMLQIEGLELYQRTGAPIIPVRPVTVLVPYGKEVKAARVILLDSFQLPGTYLLPPAQKPHPLSFQGVIERTEPDSAIYEQPLPWPGITHEQIATQSKRGYRLFTVNLFPLQYEPVSGTVTYTPKMVLQIDLTDSVRSDHLPVLKPTNKAKAKLIGKVANPSALGSYPKESSVVKLEDISNLPSGGPYKYVIITNTALESASGPYNFQALRDSKITQGTSATIVTTDWIYANYDGTRPDGGTDNQTRIRNFLIDAYQTWGTEYVLLGGTNSIVPARMFWVQAWPGGDTDTMPVDMYYGCVDPAGCTFDNDQDGYYAEPTDGVGGADVDLYAEIYVGRAPVANTTELANFINKTLTYDSTQSEYLPLISMVGEHLGFGGVAEYAKDAMEQIRLGGSYDGYFTYGFENHLNESFYDFDTSINLYDKDGSWPKSTLINLMNNSVHVLNHLGHADYTYDMKLSTSDLSSLTNTDYFFAYSQGCMPGGFDTTNCFAEVITSMEYGAFAVVMNARYGWGTFNSTDGPSQRFGRQFWDAVLDEDMPELGRANQDSKEDNLWDINGECIRWCYYELNLFGDPQQEFRFEEACEWLIIDPQEGSVAPQDTNDLSVTFDSTGLAIGTYQAEIIITSDDPDYPTTTLPVTMTVRPDDLEVTPDEDFEPTGTAEGPFEPECKSYTLTNNGTEALNWSTEETEDWLEISPYEGSLDPNESVLVNVCVTSDADLLDPNTYTDTISFLNENSGKVHLRTALLIVMPPDTFTESFDSGDNDLDNLMMTFRPDGSIAYYAACRDNEVITEFPSDPCGGTYVGLGDDDFAEVILTGGAEVLFYGQSYDRFYIGSNGYITFGDGDFEFSGTLEYHFNMPRVSAVFTDLSPADTQSISYKQLEDRLAVTFQDVPLYGDKDALNSFQIEIFFVDETIRITWLDIAATDGVAGLSEGAGLSSLFIESDLTEYISCCPCGDFNADNFVNLTDFAILGLSWMETDCNSPHWCNRIDIDRSTEVDVGDVSFVAYNWLLGGLPPEPAGPISHWKFDETSGDTAYDSAGSNDGTLIGGPVWDPNGQIDGALEFDGSGHYVNFGNDSSLDMTSGFTLGVWVNPDENVGYRRIIERGYYAGSSNNKYVSLVYHHETNTINYKIRHDNNEKLIQAPCSEGVWQHVAITYNSGIMELYINGEFADSITGADLQSAVSTYDFVIGTDIGHQAFVSFDGKIDDVRIYDRALSEAEVRELAGLSNEPVAHWKLDETSGSTAYDSAGTNDGTLIGDPNWTTGQIDGALEFDGVGDYIEIPDDDSLTPSNTITLSFWTYYKGDRTGIYKFTGCPHYPGSPGNSRAYYLQVDPSTEKATLRIFSAVTTYDDLESNTSLSIDTWHHVAATFSSGQADIYIDGQLDNSTTMSVSSIMNDAQVFSIGGIWTYCHDEVTYEATGKIDDVRIYGRALSDEEIQELYGDIDEEVINCLPR